MLLQLMCVDLQLRTGEGPMFPLVVAVVGALSCGSPQARGPASAGRLGSPGEACGRPAGSPWVATQDSVGPIRVDMHLEQVRRLCPDAADGTYSLLPYPVLVIRAFQSGLVVAEPEAEVPAGRMLVVVVRTPAIRTPEGLGVGSNLGDLRRHLGPMLVVSLDEQGFFAVPRTVSKPRLLFRLGGFDGSRVPGGWTPDDSATYSDSVAASAKVVELQLWSRPR